ncbi:hypothetical protein cje104_06987 [Campylobacter jejuni subsp. jejuni LMG 23223]|nr:hypothetical protein cje104_06987 [Campylobacter jejuni subsp. jejuni LMG 23223]EIB80707.1 hypothetical protein cje77_04355 [Campylobacter jejuni subsp. jejuni 1854]
MIAPSISPRPIWVFSESFLTSSATTANPRPSFPALAASILVFKDKRLVCSAIPEIRSKILFN